MSFTTQCVLSVWFGALGAGYLVYAKREHHAMALIAGLGMMIFPFLVSSLWLALLIGFGLAVLPFVIRIS